MTSRRCWAVAALMMAAGTARADDAAVTRQLNAVLARFQQAFRRKDAAAAAALMQPDFEVVLPNGTRLSRGQVIASMKNDWSHIQAMQDWTLRVRQVQMNGSTVRAIVEERFTVVTSDGRGHLRHNSSADNVVDTFIKTPSGWKYQRTVTLGKLKADNTQYVSAKELMKHVRRSGPAAGKTGATPAPPALKAMLNRNYARYRQAVSQKDIDTVLGQMTEDFTAIYPDHVENRAAVEAGFRKDMGYTVGIQSWTMTVRNPTVIGDKLTANVAERQVSTILDRAGKPHRQVLVDTVVDTWVKTSHGWRVRRTEMQKAAVTLDNHTFNPFKAK